MSKVVLLIMTLIVRSVTSAPSTTSSALQTKNIICVEYIAPGMNAAPEQIPPDDYSYEDEGSEETHELQLRTPSDGDPFDENVSPKSTEEIKCPNRNDVCYAVWKIDQNGTVVIVRQGCWQSDDRQETCSKKQCVSDKPKSWSKNHRFCCCSGNLCNSNVTTIEAQPEPTVPIGIINDPSPPIAPPTSILESPIVWICVVIVIMIMLALAAYFIGTTSTKSEPELAPLAPSGGPGYSSNLHNVDNLKLCSMIGQGKFGTVWKGMINDQPVAVKIFPGQHKQYFLNEKNIYSLSLMESPNILEYYGCDTRRTLNDSIEYLLVLSLAPFGCLQDWLMVNTSSFDVFVKMAKSISHGLSHLHTPMSKNNIDKPCVCHRDLNTRNILVKADLSCCIADFGFALKTFGPRYEWKGEVNLAETKSINEVGTLRYMAPEVLEGAVNLRDCETALKQIDVYSLGLVLWELCVRCHDWYPNGLDPPAYKSPYEEEAGKKPSFEHMQILISRHKVRPQFPLNWGGDTASKIARETCEDCWDHDAEARLTALCAEERIHELAVCGSRPAATNRNLTSPLSPNNFVSFGKSLATIISGSDLSTVSQIAYQSSEAAIITPPNQIIPTVSSEAICTSNRSSQSPDLVKNHGLQGRNQALQNQILIGKTLKQNFIQSSDECNTTIYNDVSVDDLIPHSSKLSSSETKLKGWYGVRAMIHKRLFKREQDVDDESNLVENNLIVPVILPPDHRSTAAPSSNDTTTGASTTKPFSKTQTDSSSSRPTNLDLSTKSNNFYKNNDEHQQHPAPQQHLTSKRRPPTDDQTNETFTIISLNPRIVVSKSANAVRNFSGSIDLSDDKQIKRQRSLEMFHEVFGAKGSIERLRDPSDRVKTPGDVPASVRKVRASKTLSLYDDRMMDTSSRNTL